MPDYDFTGLSPGSFEQLVQAITLKVISPQTIIFGEGTDGGREASYRGKTNYPSEAAPWDGYIVWQAKFRQRPDNDTKKDGDWAVSQLRKELEDFADPKKGRNKPEYYIFATNVVLTPVLDKGSKDKVYKLFKDHQDRVPLKGYDVWDYDKIARFLDNNPGIRQTYAAWITPGDVLAKVIEHLEGLNRPDFETVISNFLQKEFLSDLNANLEQAGNTKDDRIPLASVFVDLPYANRRILEASQNKEESFIVAQLIESAKQKLDSKSLRGNFSIDSGIRWTEELQKKINSGRWVIIGGPGQGKTTLGQFICQLFRVAILKDKTKINNIDVLRAIPNFRSQCQQETIALPKVRRFPIRIILNDFAAKLASQETNSLLDYIVQRIRKRTDRDIVADDLRLWLATYPWLIILDGLDEVPASSNRNQVMTAIRDFWIDANDANADMMVVATTRPQGYNEDFDTDLYNHVWLTPLSSKQALHYASRLVELRYSNDPSRQEKITSRLKRAAQDDSTTRLMQSPLQVTIMTVLCDRLGQPPKERWKLFKAYYQVIYQREVERNIPASILLREYQPDIDSIHYQMGLILQVESERSGKTDSRLSIEDFTTLVRQRLEDEGHEGQECEDLTQQIIEAAANRLVFLVGLEQDIVGFEIRSLQEFMASEAIMNGSDSQIQERLEEIIPIISWRNVVLFAIGKCFTERQYLRDTIHSSCAALNDLDDLYNATLAGSRLALDILEDGAVAQQPKYLKLFTRLALNLLDLPPDNFHVQLADVYTSSLSSIYKDELEKRISNQNYQQSLGAWTCLLQLINLGFDWAIKLAEKYWSSTEEENLAIIAAFTKQHDSLKLSDDHWIFNAITAILPKVDPLLVEEKIEWKKIKAILNSQCKWVDLFLTLQNEFNFIQSEQRHSGGILFNEIDVRFDSSPKSKVFILRFQSVFSLKNIDINDFKSDQHCSDSWNTYIAIAEFINEPCTLTLSNALKIIAQEDESKLNQIVENIYVPWHIGECLQFAQNKDDLLKLADRAEKGELGNFNDWQQAEARWKKDGITDSDFIYCYETDVPYSAKTSQVGFPLLTTSLCTILHSLSSLSDDSAKYYLPTLDKIFEILTFVNDKKIKLKLVECISRILGVSPNTIKNNFLETIAVIKKLLFNNPKPLYLNNSFIRAFMYISSIVDNKNQIAILNFIDRYGKNAKPKKAEYRIIYSNNSELNPVTEIVDQFNNNPQLLGFLKIISFLNVNASERETSEALSKVKPSLLEPNEYHDSEYKAAAIIVSLYRKTWSDDEINIIVNHAINLIEEHPRIVTRILDLIEENNFDIDVCEKFLRQLKHKIIQSEWQQLNRINRLMNEQLTTRISSLSNKSKWSDLGLPLGASSLLPE